jgi:hypothetical protein
LKCIEYEFILLSVHAVCSRYLHDGSQRISMSKKYCLQAAKRMYPTREKADAVLECLQEPEWDEQ